MAGFSLRTPARHRRRLRNGAEDNLNVNLVHVFVAQFDDLVKPLLPNVRLRLRKSQVLALDHRASYRPLARSVTVDTFFEWNIKKENRARNLKPLCQFKIFFPMMLGERGRIHHTEPVQAQPQFREVMDESEGLGLETLIPLVVAHLSSRPVRRDDLRGAKEAARKSRFSAGSGSAEQDDRGPNQSYSLLFAFIWRSFFGHSRIDGSLQDLAAYPCLRLSEKERGFENPRESHLYPKDYDTPLLWQVTRLFSQTDRTFVPLAGEAFLIEVGARAAG
jgi:hypothetical protein